MKRLNLCSVSVVVCFMIALGIMSIPVQAQTFEPIKIESGAIGLDVVDREIVGAASSFASSVTKLYCFTTVVGAQESTYVIHAWYYGDMERARVSLPVNSMRWRTCSSKLIQKHETGAWHVDVLDEDGNLLDSFPFEIVQ
ncbi:MAG: DUF2914 domain-containing protein [Deltaproteobacteria bacterium]|nr:DUF2914 domain-containing protein [Deltaproteobacteria bacterium]